MGGLQFNATKARKRVFFMLDMLNRIVNRREEKASIVGSEKEETGLKNENVEIA